MSKKSVYHDNLYSIELKNGVLLWKKYFAKWYNKCTKEEYEQLKSFSS